MVTELIRRSLYPLAVTTIVATLWVLAWSKSLSDEAAHGGYPSSVEIGHASQR
jgi:hypothetical protein